MTKSPKTEHRLRKNFPEDRGITLPPRDYQPTKAETKQNTTCLERIS